MTYTTYTLSALVMLWIGGLSACAQLDAAPDTASDLPLFGDGYRTAEDPCQRVGESSETVNFLDDAADLVGCPSGSAAAASFQSDTGGIPVATLSGYDLFSVPVR